MTDRKPAARRSTEAHFQRQVEQLARFYGWRIFHAPDNRPVTASSGRRYVQAITPGWPDLFLIRDVEIIVAELKGASGRLSPEQLDWLDAFRDYAAAISHATFGDDQLPTFDVYVWRPRDFDEIHERLARGRVRTEPLYRAS